MATMINAAASLNSAVLCPRTVTLRSTVLERPTRSMKLMSSSTMVGVRAAAVDVSKIVPQADRILLRLDSLAEQTSGGVLLPKSAVKYERYLVGEVLAIGSEVAKIEKGNRVLVSDMNAYEVNLGTPEKLCFARAGDLLAVME